MKNKKKAFESSQWIRDVQDMTLKQHKKNYDDDDDLEKKNVNQIIQKHSVIHFDEEGGKKTMLFFEVFVFKRQRERE